MIVKIYRRHDPDLDRTTISGNFPVELPNGQVSSFEWEGETPQAIADLLGERSAACFAVAVIPGVGLLIGKEAACPP